MCVEPVSLTIASAGIGLVGNLMAGFSKRAEANANAAALEVSAQQREQKAIFDTEREANRFTRQQGTVVAKAGSTNVDLQSFSDVLADDAKESALARKAIAVSASIDEHNLRFQAAGQRRQANAALLTGIFSAAGSVVSAGTQYEKMRELDTKYTKLGAYGTSDYEDA